MLLSCWLFVALTTNQMLNYKTYKQCTDVELQDVQTVYRYQLQLLLIDSVESFVDMDDLLAHLCLGHLLSWDT